MPSIEFLFWGIFAALVCLITFIDARSYRIPNSLVIVLAAIGAVFVYVTTPTAIGAHLMLAAMTMAVGYVLFLFTGFGAGDAKFFAAIMIWVGASGVIPLLFWFGVCCALLVVVLIAARRAPSAFLAGLSQWRPFQKDAPVPLALAIGPAAILACLTLMGQ